MWSVLQYAMRYSHSDSIVHKRGTGMTGTGRRQDESRTAALGTSGAEKEGRQRDALHTPSARGRGMDSGACAIMTSPFYQKTTTGAAGRADGPGSAACHLRL
ncbi:unnamed protein product [Cercospora beticola]|nr:unnamed protein product [Cercospora beticola]